MLEVAQGVPPRTSPYSFCWDVRVGLFGEAKKQTGLPVGPSEILDTRDIELFLGKSRHHSSAPCNIQNFELLKEVGVTAISRFC